MKMKYLIFFVLILSCKSQQNKNIYESEFIPIFTTSEWKRLVVGELEKQLEVNQNQKDRILEHINFIKSKDDSFLEKKFADLQIDNKSFNSQNDFSLIINFSNTEGSYEYLYLLNEKECRSYFLVYGRKKHSKREKNCEPILNRIKSLENSVTGEGLAFNQDLITIWRVNNGKYELKVFHKVTVEQLDLMESIFYDSNN